jgi:hypothetical protein
MHGIERKRHGARHGQVKPHKALQTLGATAMSLRLHHSVGGDQGYVRVRLLHIFLHCGTFLL